jgi:hypothetical protein
MSGASPDSFFSSLSAVFVFAIPTPYTRWIGY